MQKSVIVVGIIVVMAIAIYGIFGSKSQKNTETQGSDIKWHTDLDSALQEAKSANKTVFIDFYAIGCSSCQRLDEQTLSDPQVKKKLNQSYVPVKIDIDKNPELVSQFKIYGVPTIVFLNSSGPEIKRHEGYIDQDGLLNQL